MRAALLVVLAGCASVPEAPCEATGDAALDLSPADVAFDAFEPGDPLPFGPPPQGGAPYTPLQARVSGLEGLDRGVTIALSAVDLDDGADLGAVSYDLRLVCANVGDSAGTWVAPEVHFRYFGWDLDGLPGREAEITATVEDLDGNVVEASIVGVLSPM